MASPTSAHGGREGGSGASVGAAGQHEQHASHHSSSRADSATGNSALGGFGQSLVQEVDHATTKWMKMISSTFLGESGSASLFARRAPALTASARDRSGATRRTGNMRELKIALVGGSAVGKTSIVRRWLQRSYPSQYAPTIGIDVHVLEYLHKPTNETVLLHLWDVSSAEVDPSAASLHALLCDGLDGLFCVFNVHRVSSIAAIDKWRHALEKYTTAREVPFFLLSHKADLLQKRVMTSDDIAAYARTGGYRGWMWTVGRSNFGENDKHPAVLDALERLVGMILPARDASEHAHATRVAAANSLWTHATDVPMDVVAADDALDAFSASLLRMPTQTITTTPRSSSKPDEIEPVLLPPAAVDYGGNWILGQSKGVYLQATNDSFVANDETEDDDVTEPEVFTFPFATLERLDGEREREEEEEEQEEEEEEEKDGEEATDVASGRERGALHRRPRVAANAMSSNDESDESEEEEESDELRRLRERQQHDRVNDELAWRFFAGSIDRLRTEQLLADKDEGTFLLRRKDAQTLILSYVGVDHIHHVLVEYTDHKYHIGTSKTSQAAFATLWKCLRSVRRYAYRGLLFTRTTAFRVAPTHAPTLAPVHATADALNGSVEQQPLPVTPSIWRSRTGSSSSSSSFGGGGGTDKRTKRPKAPPTRLVTGLQAAQEHVRVPPQTRIEELESSYYAQLTERLALLASDTTSESDHALVGGAAAIDDVRSLLALVEREQHDLKTQRHTGNSNSAKHNTNDAESQWRQLVKNMETWNRIVMNLELRSLRMQ